MSTLRRLALQTAWSTPPITWGPLSTASDRKHVTAYDRLMLEKTEAISRVTSHFLRDAAREVLLRSPLPPDLHELHERPARRFRCSCCRSVDAQSTSAPLTVMAATLCQAFMAPTGAVRRDLAQSNNLLITLARLKSSREFELVTSIDTIVRSRGGGTDWSRGGGTDWSKIASVPVNRARVRVCVCVCEKERERERETDRQRAVKMPKNVLKIPRSALSSCTMHDGLIRSTTTPPLAKAESLGVQKELLMYITRLPRVIF